jgi:hypothetical protein
MAESSLQMMIMIIRQAGGEIKQLRQTGNGTNGNSDAI